MKVVGEQRCHRLPPWRGAEASSPFLQVGTRKHGGSAGFYTAEAETLKFGTFRMT